MGTLLTIVLSAAAGALAGHFSGLKADRRRAEDRLRGVARALSADMERIRQELGGADDRLTGLRVHESEPIPPNLHPWTSGLIPEVANIHSGVLVLFFRLERALHNYGVSVRTHGKILDRITEVRDELELIDRQTEAPERGGDPIAVETWQRQTELRRELERLEEDDGILWHDSAVDERRRAYEIMGEISDELSAYLPDQRERALLPTQAAPPGRS